MAARDIMPALSEHGGHNSVRHFRMGALTTDATEDTSWLEGEVLLLDGAAGDINYGGVGAAGTISAAGGLTFVAAASSAGLIAAAGGTSGAATHNIMVPCYDMADDQQVWVTRNVFDNSDTNIGPAGTGTNLTLLVGMLVDLWVDDSSFPGHVWGLDLNAGAHFVVERILNATGQDIGLTGEAVTLADKILFRRIASAS